MRTPSQEFSALDMALGFLAAAIAVLAVHQGIIYLLGTYKFLPPAVQAWSMKPFGPFNVPTVLNNVFWGGLWGVLFALVWPKLPGGAMWLRGLIFGLLVLLFSNWMLLPLIKGKVFGQANQVFFAGFDPQRMLIGAAILGGFGLALGLLFGLMRGRS